MTPAVVALRRAGVEFTLHEYDHDPYAVSFGWEAAEILNLNPARVFKTLLVSLEGGKTDYAVGLLPVIEQLRLKYLAKKLAAKRAAMANPTDARKVTGYVLGGISPFGQKKNWPTVLDESALCHPTIFVSGGRRGLEIEVAPCELLSVCRADSAGIAG